MASSEEVIDPVCGMTMEKSQAPHTREHSGTVFHLCSMECARKFDADGDAYATVSRLQLPGWGLTPHPENIVKQFRESSPNA